MFTFAVDYYLFVLVSSLGVIQFAASMGRLNGLLIFKSPWVARALSLALASAAFLWFFATDTRNLNDYEGGLDANVQSILFVLGALTAVVVTLGVSSAVNARMHGGRPSQVEGLDALKTTNYLRALIHSFRYWRRHWRTQTKSYFSG